MTTLPDPADAGVVGNGDTLFVIDAAGRIGWWCVPRFDGYPILASALDPRRGGSFEVSPELTAATPGNQAYYPGSNVLVTCPAARVPALALVDATWWGHPALVREVWAPAGAVGEAGRVMARLRLTRAAIAGEWRMAPGEVPALEARDAAVALAVRPHAETRVFAAWDAPARELRLEGHVGDTGLGGEAAPPHPLLEGLRPLFRIALGYGRTADQARRAALAAVARPIGPAVESDREWLRGASVPPGLSPGMRALFDRSLLALRVLTYPPTGAILAAGTASWPATPGGQDNWDYRFTWLRDGAWTAWALDRAGLHREARAFLRFALRHQGEDGHWSQPLYTVDGTLPQEYEAPELAGPSGERPLRFGNAAAHQLQLDGEGNVLFAIEQHVRLTGDRSFAWEAWDSVRRAASWVEAHYDQVESGIWELRGMAGHWLHGKTFAAVALASAAHLSRLVEPRSQLAASWEEQAGRIVSHALDRAWSPRRHAFMRVFSEDGPAEHQPLDISVLAPLLWGFVSPADRRVHATLEAMAAPSERGGLWVPPGGVKRFADGALPFFMAGMWMVRALIRAGQRDRAATLLDRLARGANRLGLMAEHHDPVTGRQWGNFPQAFSHEELVHALIELHSDASA